MFGGEAYRPPSARSRPGDPRHRGIGMGSMVLRFALLVGALVLVGAYHPAEAFKRAPNGCDWIGGDFAEPGEVIFNTGCRPGVRRGGGHAGVAQPKDEPPKLLDRLDARAPVHYGASTRQSLGAGIERFEIVDRKVAYGLDGSGRLWRFVIGAKDSTMVAPSIAKFTATDVGMLFLLEKDGTLWRAGEDGANRTFLDHQVADFQPSGDFIYVLGLDKRLSRLHADGKIREPVDETVAAFQAVDASTIFVLGSDGALWRETGDFHHRVKVGQPISAFNYVAAGDATYVLAPDHILWRKISDGAPQQVDHDVAAFHPVDASLVYVLATDGRLWREPGGRAEAALVDGDLAVKSGADAFQFGGTGDDKDEAVYVLDRKHGLWVETMPSTRGDGQARAP
jgi:hypothetical protein